MQERRPQQEDRFIIRFYTPGQRDALKIRAIRNKRSTNAELLHLIERGIAAVDAEQQESKQ